MANVDVMDDIDYKLINFNIEESEHRHPLWLTEAHFIYNLYRDEGGHLNCHRDSAGEPICSPRPLSNMCMKEIVCDGNQIPCVDMETIPADLYPMLLAEAIFQRQIHAIDFLVSTWPHSVLDLQSVMPKEDLVEPYLLTVPIEGHDGVTFLDCIMCGLLRRKESSRLKTVNLCGFKQDRRLSREICRLPMLWIPPHERTVDQIFGRLSTLLDITEEKVERYLNRIRCIYEDVDPHVPHRRNFPTVTIILDCKMTLDDVPIGLALQEGTPFRFASQRLWVEHISDVCLPLNLLNKVLEPRDLTHLEIEDRDICSDESRLDLLLEALLLLPHIKCLSLPNSIHCDENEESAGKINYVLRQLTNLKKLNFTLCNLRGRLGILLGGLPVKITYLSLKDCRLSHTDILFLLELSSTPELLDLNLSRNNLQSSFNDMLSLVGKLPEVRCLSLSYCSFSVTEICTIVSGITGACARMKILGIQSFVPFSETDSRKILKECCLLTDLQKCLILPDTHAFLGSNDLERFETREKYSEFCENILSDLNRTGIELE